MADNSRSCHKSWGGGKEYLKRNPSVPKLDCALDENNLECRLEFPQRLSTDRQVLYK